MRIEHILNEEQLNELGTGPGINPALQARLDARRQAKAAGANPPAGGTPAPAAPNTPPAPAAPPSGGQGGGVVDRLSRGVDRVNKEIHKWVGKIPGIGSSVSGAAQPAAAPAPAAPKQPAAQPNLAGLGKPSAQLTTQQNFNAYVRGVAGSLNAARDPNQKIALTKELVNYMADRKNYPEWQSALPSVKIMLKRANLNPNFTQQAIANVESGKLMAEAWQMDYINQLLEAVNLTWKDLGLTVVEDAANKQFNILESSSYDAELNDMLSLTRRLTR
jgi:hypothetical protein